MTNVWLAQVGPDPHVRAREIAAAHARFVAGRTVGPGLRDLVVRSWMRSSDAHAGAAGAPPVTLTDDDLYEYRAAHPLSAVVGVLRDLVGPDATHGDHLMSVCDAAGRLLWVEGHRVARARAERMNFVEGAWWDETHAGTATPGTALALDHEVQIFASEHFLPAVQQWSCSGAPIHDPATGRMLGVVSIGGGHAVAHPMSLALVRAAARAAENALDARRPAGRADVRLDALGHGEGRLRLRGRSIRLHRRHTEIMTMLVLHPDGLTGEQLAAVLYHDLTRPATLRVEINRLRHIVGDLLASRPYRLTEPVAADFVDIAAALRRDDLPGALEVYRGPLLPGSDAPGVVEQRAWIDTRMRAAVLVSVDPEVVRAWADRAGYDDLAVWERLATVAPATSIHRVVAAGRVAWLRADYRLGSRATLM